MRLGVTVVVPGAAVAPADVELSVEPGTTLAEVRADVLTAAGCAPNQALFIDGQLIGDDAVLGRPPLLHGAVISVGRPGVAAAGRRGQGFLQLHVVGGPDAGDVHWLAPGRHRVGRAPGLEVRVGDPDVSRLHARLEVGPHGVRVQDAASTNGTWLDGRLVPPSHTPLPPGGRLRVGSSTLVLRLPDVAAAATRVTGEGHIEVNRAPRMIHQQPVRDVAMPEEPALPQRARLPLVAMLLPLALSIPMALLWSPFMLLLGLSTPLMMGLNAVTDARSGRRRHATQLRDHQVRLQEAQQQIDAARGAEELQRHEQAPDAAALWTAVSTPSTRLWERRPSDDDWLELRAGTGPAVATSVRLRLDGPTVGDRPAPPVLDAVPLTVRLPELGVVGVSGPRALAAGLVRFLLAQVAALHSPRDVTVAVLATSGTAASEWAWVRWLPHAGVGACRLPVACEDADVRRQVAALCELVRVRQGQAQTGSGARGRHGADVVLVLDGASRLRTLPGIAQLLADGPEHGVLTICLDDDPERLPVECGGTVHLAGEVGSWLRLRLPGGDDGPDGATVDAVSAGWAHRLAHALAPLRDATPGDGAGHIPPHARLLDLLPQAHPGLDPLRPEAVSDLWRVRPRTTRVVLGVGAKGLYAPDLAADGPHLLVGGTTGSGKSELLQTLIASLAVGNAPHELALVLIDYKGGAAFAGCERLPHTVGLVTDLDEHLTRRALVSLTAEVRRRERLLQQHGAKDLPEYQALLDAGAARAPLPRLVLVVDEFRVLAEELPDFVPGLVRLAAVGRSLGLHLVLATQRPGGVIGPDIQANVNLRVALRVRDRVDSTDVVEAPDAAMIDPRRPGRALARAGSSELVEFQTARVAGAPRRRRRTTRVVPLRWDGDPAPDHPAPGEDGGPTDLDRLAECLTAAAARLGQARQPSPWLPPLPEHLELDALLGRLHGTGELAGADELLGTAELPGTGLLLGLLDEPEQLAQPPFERHVGRDGALLVAGAARSGRTTVLRAFAAAASRMPADGLHLYAVDGSGAGLADLEDLPHTGAVAGRDDIERICRLLRRLAAEVTERRATPGVAEERPQVLLLVDGWEALQPELEDSQQGAPVGHLLQILREGPAVRVVAVVAGDRGLLTGRLAAAVPDRLLLRMADPLDAVLAGVSPSDVPGHQPPGRGLLVADGRVRQVQVALPGAPLAVPSPLPRRGREPWRVPAFPARLEVRDLSTAGSARPGLIPIGVGGEDVVPVGFGLDELAAAVVAGPAGSGRSTTLATLGHGLLRAGVRVLVVSPRPSPLTRLPGADAVLGLGDAGALAEALGVVGDPGVVLVDDAEAIDGTPVEPVLADLLGDAAAGQRARLVLAGTTTDLAGRFRGVVAEARRSRTGVLLAPTGYADGDVLGVVVARASSARPGRGVLVRRGEVTAVQVATPGG